MRAAFLTEKYPPDIGGLAVSAARLVQLLTAAGVEVHVFVPADHLAPGQMTCENQVNPIVHRFGVYRRTDDSLTAWFDYLTAAHQQRPFDLIHTYFITRAGFVAVYAGRFLNLPVVVSARGNDLDRAVFDPAKAAHILYALSHADAVTANCTVLARKAQALAPGCREVVIPNGIDAAQYQPGLRDERLVLSLGLENKALLGFVGEARAKKGLAPMLLAFQEIAHDRPAALLLVGGVRPGEDQEMVTVFKKQNPDLTIHVVPYLPHEELPAYYNLMDVLLLPSLRDGLPNALLEGMACERAVAAAAAGGMTDVIRDGENGLLIPPGDVEALVGAVRELLDDKEKRLRIGHNARNTIRQSFTLEKELQANLDLYRQLGVTV